MQEYLTQYQTTVVFNPRHVFDVTVASLSNRAQLQPVESTVEQKEPEYITPEVLILNVEVTKEMIDSYLQRGHQFIHVFKDAISNEFATELAESFPPHKLVVFDVNDLLEHLYLVPGLTSENLIDLIATAVYDEYKSINKETTKKRAEDFLRYVQYRGGNFGEMLLELCNSPHGFDKTNEMIIRGEMCQDISNRVNTRAIENLFTLETEHGKICYINGPYLDIVKKLPVDYVMFFNFELIPVENTEKVIEHIGGWRLTVVSMKKSASSLLREYTENVTTSENNPHIATCWLTSQQVSKPLYFLFEKD
jgi:hypothetical protein